MTTSNDRPTNDGPQVRHGEGTRLMEGFSASTQTPSGKVELSVFEVGAILGACGEQALETWKSGKRVP